MLAVMGSLTVAEMTERLLYEHASTWRAVVGLVRYSIYSISNNLKSSGEGVGT
jgi:hypothetical protein